MIDRLDQCGAKVFNAWVVEDAFLAFRDGEAKMARATFENVGSPRSCS
jgi:hypothetical protein